MVILEKEVHPRQKLCAGGLTRFGLNQLQQLGLRLAVPYFPVLQARMLYQHRQAVVRGNPLFVVIQRPEFDAWLADEARARGIELIEDCRLETLQRKGERIFLQTSRGAFEAGFLVGADGSRGIIRPWLGFRDHPPQVARTLEERLPADGHAQEFQGQMAIFDFSAIDQSLQGYCWRFPGWQSAQPVLNVGIYDSRILPHRRRAALMPLFQRHRRQTADPAGMGPDSHPIRWFSPQTRFTASRTLLVGDAAGVDPLFGEGIGPALGQGILAAQAIAQAFATRDYRLSGYRRRLLGSAVGRYLLLRYAIARLIYHAGRSPRRMAAVWSAAQLAAAVFAANKKIDGIDLQPPIRSTALPC